MAAEYWRWEMLTRKRMRKTKETLLLIFPLAKCLYEMKQGNEKK